MDLNLVQIEDVPCTSEAIRRLTSLGREKMPDATRITDFDYNPPTEDSEAAPKGTEAKEEVKDDEATPTAQDPLAAP